MLASTLLFTLMGAATAFASPEIHHLVTRQSLSSANIPSSCQSGCTGALDIYNACLSGNTQTCLSVCQSSNFNSFVGCFNCILSATPGVSSSDYTQLQGAISQLQSACAAAGQTVSATASLSRVAASGSGSGSASGAGASFTSATSGVTIGGGSASGSSTTSRASTSTTSSSSRPMAGESGGVAASVSGAASSAASVAASSSRNAGQAVAILPQGFAGLGGVVLAAIGAGAALVL